MRGSPNPLGVRVYQRIARLLASETTDFNALVRLAKLDPTKDFRHADLAGTSVAGADLRGFDFSFSDFRNVDVTGASIAGARFERADLAGTDLSKAKGIDGAHLDLAIIQDAPFAPELVVIPAGRFLMGSTEAEHQWAVAQGAAPESVKCEKPQHQVRIAYSLAVGRYPVTFEEYDHFAQATGREPPDDEGWGHGRRPVINVSWHDAEAYVDWLTTKTRQPYRLLSEAEWEYASRAETTTYHWWGDEIAPDNANYGSSVGKTSEVGGYPPNPWCLYDTNGNVWEWVEDRWNENYEGTPDDGRAWKGGDSNLRVIRGSSWKSKPGIVRAAYRNRHKSIDRENNIGLRVARALIPWRRRPTAGQDDQLKPISLFYSYSHKDEDLRRKLETHLAVLRRGGLIVEWHDRKIEAGDAWKDQIDRHLMSADIVLLLVSSDFIASDYCWGEEMTKALERHERGEARVIPVILRHCRWQSTPLARLQATPRDAKPIKSWLDEDEAFDDVVAAIERSVQTAREKVATTEPPAPPQKSVSSQRLPDLTVFRDVDAPWCPELVVIPAGELMMGSTEAERQWAVEQNARREWVEWEKPQHLVRIAYRLAVGRYPVMFKEYAHFAHTTGRAQPADQGWGRGRRPVINVDWEDAKSFVAWLSVQTGERYHLLSEAEWEYACRAGTTTRYWWGDEITPENANYSSDGGRTSEVGSYPANPFGLYDMHGNVWEWVEDRWHDRYNGAPDDGSAWIAANDSRRVLRGGSWSRKPGGLRAASRGRSRTDDRKSNFGFRVARTIAS